MHVVSYVMATCSEAIIRDKIRCFYVQLLNMLRRAYFKVTMIISCTFYYIIMHNLHYVSIKTPARKISTHRNSIPGPSNQEIRNTYNRFGLKS